MKLKYYLSIFCATLSLMCFGEISAIGTQLALANSSIDGQKQLLEVKQPWSRQTPKSAQVAGGYMTITNHSPKDDLLVKATSPLCKEVEIHNMAINNGVMEMRQLKDGLLIPAGKEVVFKPGGLHIMFMGLNHPLIKGERFKANLHFKNHGVVPVEFQVEAMGALQPSK